MKILVVHNRYRIRAGEDTVFEREVKLLTDHNHEVKSWTVDNLDIVSSNFFKRLKLAIDTIWCRDAYRQISQIISEFKPDIVHVHNTLPLLSPSVFYACQAAKVPVVQTIHNYRMGCPVGLFFRDGKTCEACLQKSLLQSIRYRCYRNSYLQTSVVALMLQTHRWIGTWQNAVDGYIAVSQFVQSKLIELKFPASKIFLKPNFVDANLDINKTSDTDSNKEIKFGDYFLFVGRLVEEKGIRILLQEYELAKTHFPLIIVGSGELEDLVLEAAALNPKIRYVGQQSKSQVLEWMQDAIALIFPSLCYEGLPLSIVEAYSCLLPVIGSGIGAIASTIIPNQTGLLFSPFTAQSLVTCLQEVELQPQIWLELKQNIKHHINPQYFSESNYQQLIKIYETVMLNKRTAANHTNDR